MTVKRSANSTPDVGLPQTVTAVDSHELAVASQHEAPIPLASKAVFWQPRHLAASGSVMHLPFLFWLVETVRPASVVQLGLRDGVGFMGLCQAVDKLGLDAVCMGLQAPNDDAAKLSDKLLESHASLYGDFSFIIKEDAGRAARHMRSAQVDILVIDMAVDEAFLTSLKAHWEPLLSDRAVIVLHDAARNFAHKEAEKFYDQMLQSHQTISFPQADAGLDVILYGQQQPERLNHLAQLELGDSGYLSARNVFARLGQGHENAQQARSKTLLLEKAKAALKEAEARIELLKAEQGPMQDTVRAAQEAEEALLAENAVLQAQIFDLGRKLDNQKANTAVQDEIDDLRRALVERDAQIATLQQEHVQEQDRLKALSDQYDAAQAETVALQERLTQAEALLQETAQKSKALQEEKSTLDVALAQEQKKRKEHWGKLESATADKAALTEQLNAAELRCQAADKGLVALAEEKAALEAALVERDAEAQAALAARTKEHGAKLSALEEALAQEQKKRKEHWGKLESATLDKAALTEQLNAAEVRCQEAEKGLAALAEEKAALEQKLASQQKKQSEELASLQKSYQDKLRSGQEKRLALWEAFEALKREHQALLRETSAEVPPAVAQEQD